MRIRYHKPNNTAVTEEQSTFSTNDLHGDIEATSPQFRLAVSVVEYAELLRHSRWTQGTQVTTVLDLADGAARDLRSNADVIEYVNLLNQAARLAPDE